MLLDRFLEDAAQTLPDQIALTVGERRLTFGQIERDANRLAHGFAALGVRRGDRVAIYLESGVEAVVSLFAALKAGAAFMMINAGVKAQKLRLLLCDSEARILVLPSDKLAGLGQPPGLRVIVTIGESAEAEVPVVSYAELLRAHPERRPRTRCIDLDLAALLYTSGSTGDPKGVMLTHLNVCTAIASIVEYLHITGRDVLLNVLPLSFGYGLTQLFSACKAGARFLQEPGVGYPHLLLRKLAAERVTGFAMVPTIAALLAKIDLSRYELGALRYITNAGAALPITHAKRLRAALPHVDLVCMYGQTECLRISYLEPSQIDRRPGSVGTGMPNQDLFLVDEQGNLVAPGAIGELVVRGSHVMKGYWRRPEETKQRLRPGRFAEGTLLYTNDLFRMDEDGYLYFVSRKDDIIKSRGEKVSPLEVEAALHDMPGVAEAAVLGLPDPVLGEAVNAFVVLADGVEYSAGQVQKHCAQVLEDYMVPTHVRFVAELPRTSTGKIAKGRLK